MKPDWKDAPESAKYLAMDKSGRWWWYEKKPFRWDDERVEPSEHGNIFPAYLYEESWEDSLESRP